MTHEQCIESVDFWQPWTEWLTNSSCYLQLKKKKINSRKNHKDECGAGDTLLKQKHSGCVCVCVWRFYLLVLAWPFDVKRALFVAVLIK